MIKSISAAVLSTMLLVGCAEKSTVIVQPLTHNYPKFDTSMFTPIEDFELEIYDEYSESSVDDNYVETVNSFTVLERDKFIDLIEYTKTNKDKYNVLLKELNRFNANIDNLKNVNKPIKD